VRNSASAGARTLGLTLCVCPSSVRYCAPGTASATACVAFASRTSVLEPWIASVGILIDARRAVGTLNPVITAASYGSVCATAFILRQIHGMSCIMTTISAGTPTIDRMKYFTAPARLPAVIRASSRRS